MGFFDDLGKKVSDAGQKTIQKTKEISDTARINSLITEEEKRMNNVYCQIGKLYISSHRNDCEEVLVELASAVFDSEEKIQGYRKQLQEIRGVICCESCGTEIPNTVSFCSVCGAKVSEREEINKASVLVECPGCGQMMPKGTKFCTACGKAISESMQKQNMVGDEESIN